MEHDGIAGEHFLLEFDPVDFHEVGGVVLRVLHRGQCENAAHLGHGLHLQHARHHWVVGEVALEERLVHGDVLDACDAAVVHVHDAVHQQEGVAVGQHGGDFVDVHQRRTVEPEVRQVFLRLDGFGQNLGELDVGGVARTRGKHVSLDEAPGQGQISDDVQQLVTRGFVREPQVRRVEHAGLVGGAGQGFAAQGLGDA